MSLLIVLNYCTNQKPDAKPKLLAAPNVQSSKPTNVATNQEDFYAMFERISANALSEKDMKRFIAAMKEVS